MKLRILALALLVALLIGMMPGVQASGALFFVGVNNDIPVLLSGDTAPFYANGMLYAPYTVFTASPGGINISYDEENGTLALFTMSRTVAFDLAEGTMTTKQDGVTKVDVIYRNGVLYLPVEQAIAQFGISVSLITSASGCMVLRFKDGTEVYDDAEFLVKSEMFISHMLDTYGGQELGGEVVAEQVPEQEEEEMPIPNSMEIYLGFSADAVSQSTLGHLDAMEYIAGTEITAVFFLTPEQIRDQKQLIREIVVAGHLIGLTASGDEDVQAQLTQANALLDETIYQKSVLALLPEQTEALPSYRVFQLEHTVGTVEELLENPMIPTLVLCTSEVELLLGQLAMLPIQVLPLLETTVLQERIPAETE